MNPELRQTLQRVTRNIESANETAQENIYTFSQNYIDPCLASISSCLVSCTEPCFPSAAQSRKRRRAASVRRGSRTRGRAELSFDFYDDWDDEFGEEAVEGDALLGGWGHERLDRLLAGNQQHLQYGTGDRPGDGTAKQPRRQRGMSYGSKSARRLALPQEDGTDPTIIPSSSYLGFLDRLPWKIGGRKLRYKPSAAGLQEHPGGNWKGDQHHEEESEPLIEASDEDEDRVQSRKGTGHGRKRSSTNASQSTTNSLSSRGDLIPSDDELEADAVPLDDEFTMGLERRTTDDRSSGRAGSGKRPINSRTSTRSASAKSARSASNKSQKPASGKANSIQEADEVNIPSLGDLKQEEEQIRVEEETDVDRRRELTTALAQDRGLLPDGQDGLQNTSTESTYQPEMRQESNLPSVAPSATADTDARKEELDHTDSKDNTDSG